MLMVRVLDLFVFAGKKDVVSWDGAEEGKRKEGWITTLKHMKPVKKISWHHKMCVCACVCVLETGIPVCSRKRKRSQIGKHLTTISSQGDYLVTLAPTNISTAMLFYQLSRH